MSVDENAREFAYRKMIEFLGEYIGESYDIKAGEILGAIELSDDGISMDPAAISIWNAIWDVSSR